MDAHGQYVLTYPVRLFPLTHRQGISFLFPVPEEHRVYMSKLTDLPFSFPDGRVPVVGRVYIHQGMSWKENLQEPVGDQVVFKVCYPSENHVQGGTRHHNRKRHFFGVWINSATSPFCPW